MTDLQLSLGKQSCEPLDYSKIEIKRGKLVTDVPALEGHELFKRYEFTEDGVSPRVLPGEKGGLHHVTGVEHDEVGRPSESAINRQKMMDKRLGKLNDVYIRDAIRVDAPHERPDLLIIGMGSTGGTIDQARSWLAEEGITTNHITIRQIHPFPTKLLLPYLQKAGKVLVVENNATAQLASQIKMHAGFAEKIESLLKYDGNPFLPSHVHHACKELSLDGNVQRV
ncbi:2-oxoglutarate oxidoreductase subunit KorA [compost metagenome]